MSAAQVLAIVAIALPALALVLWPLRRRRAPAAAGDDAPARDERRLELTEEKASIYRALKELAFDHEAGHLSDDDHAELRARYEGRAAEILRALDALGSAPDAPSRGPSAAAVAPAPRARQSWTRSPAALGIGAGVLLVFGVALGLGIGRFTEPQPPDTTMAPPGIALSAPGAGGPPSAMAPGLVPGSAGDPPSAMAPGPVPGSAGGGSGKALAPEMLAGMLQAARQSLSAGRYPEAIAAYQAILKREPKNVDAMTHLGLIVAIGGHADSALETWDKALAIQPDYAPAFLYRGQVLYEVKNDYPGAIKAWERFATLVPSGEDHDRATALIAEARSKQRSR
jgi:tetratricopeptide (TPR) repeat protein